MDLLAYWKNAGATRPRGLSLALFILWLSLVLYLEWHHAFWRDEVRVLSVAKEGSLVSMLEGLHEEGHPAVWFLIVRGAYFLIGSPAALWLASIGVASAAVFLLIFRSPFRWPLIAVFLFGRIALFEYSVMARDYGISMLLMFLFSVYYWRYRDRGVVLGSILFLLANTNVPSVMLAGAFLLFWFVDIMGSQGLRWTPTFKIFLVNAGIAAIGVIICFTMLYPPSADAIPIGPQSDIGLRQLVEAIFEPARAFSELIINKRLEPIVLTSPGAIAMSLIMFGSLFGLIRSPAALISALAALIGFSLFFTLIFPGSYRHEALWLVFLVSMYWIAREKDIAPELQYSAALKSIANPVRLVGSALMLLLLVIQLPRGLNAIAEAAFDLPPHSRSRDFGKFVLSRPELKDAIIIADPDPLLEAVPYYINNPTYLMREQRFGSVVNYTKNARLSLDLNDILATAHNLSSERRKPILILLTQRLDPSQPATTYLEAYNWQLNTTPEQVRGFLSSTRLLIRFAPARTDESFDVYLYAPS
jgi:hypothetical protein